MVREVRLDELFPSKEIQSLSIHYLPATVATDVMVKFRGQIVRTEMKDFILIEGRDVAVIHIDEET